MTDLIVWCPECGVTDAESCWHYRDAPKEMREELLARYERLIAAAPSLLHELKTLVARCDGEEGVQPDGSNMSTLAAHVAIQLAEEGNTAV